jgi:hypothetical protein
MRNAPVSLFWVSLIIFFNKKYIYYQNHLLRQLNRISEFESKRQSKVEQTENKKITPNTNLFSSDNGPDSFFINQNSNANEPDVARLQKIIHVRHYDFLFDKKNNHVKEQNEY